MTNHAYSIVPLAALALAGCAAQSALNVRPVGRQSSAADQPVSVRVALAQGHLALGNVALALEEYRRAEREQPGSAVALAGMAECYRMMGRTDLSRRYYEQALAIAPTEPALYHALATALDDDGQKMAAQSVRAEVATRVAARSLPVTTIDGSLVSMPVALDPPSSAPSSAPASVPASISAEPASAAAMPALARPASSVTITLPPARPVTPTKSAARLERLSSGEVALMTSGASPWSARRVALNKRSVRVQFAKREPMLVLNGARVEGIAARTRDYLASRGFAGARIGDAPRPVAQTLIRFPSYARARALRIAAQFRNAPRMEAREGQLTLIIGRDGAGRAGHAG